MGGVFGVNLYARFTERSDDSGGIAQMVLKDYGRHPVGRKLRDAIGKPPDNQVYQSARATLREHVQIEELGRESPIVVVSDETTSGNYRDLVAKLRQIKGLKFYDETSIRTNDVIDGMVVRLTRLGNNNSHAQK